MKRPLPFNALVLLWALFSWSAVMAAPAGIGSFVQKNCLDCHAGKEAKAGLNLQALKPQLDKAESFERWVRIFDRVRLGEMPPPDDSSVSAANRKKFVAAARRWLNGFQRQQWRESGRVRGRRLTNLQLERTLHDLLGVDIPLAALMPEESSAGFTTTASQQTMSRFHLQEHLKVVDAALDEAFRRAVAGDEKLQRMMPAKRLARRNARRRNRSPEMIDGLAVIWSSRLAFYGRIPTTRPRQGGWYRLTLRAKGLKCPPGRGVWCTIRSGQCISSAPLLSWIGSFEVRPQMKQWSFVAWIPRGHMLEIRPGDATLKLARFRGGQVGVGEGGPQNVPGLAMESLKIEKIHLGQTSAGIREVLFGDLKLRPGNDFDASSEVTSANPTRDLSRLMLRFAQRAFRRPVAAKAIAPYVTNAQAALNKGKSFESALRLGYRSLLCSPRFIYLQEQPGKLDDYALASRLSYFLWNTMPDRQLLKLAARRELNKPPVIRREVRRMLKHDKGKRFVSDFAAQWLDLDQINFTTPDRRLYRNFDPIVQHSMVAETERYLQDLVDRNATVSLLVKSGYTYLNERLARYYKIAGVKSDQLRKTRLKPKDRRGGLITHGAILKVTANGTNTSPVLRGAWISERLLGEKVPPPPAGIPAIEPDVRGAKSIREILAKHKADPSCASCHRTIDPPGFALENFDAAGRWRWRYFKRRGRRVVRGPKVDASGQFANGGKFGGLRAFQNQVALKKYQLAANVAEKLIAYGTGAPVTFADRNDVHAIVKRAKDSKFGFRTIIEEVVCAKVFQIK